MGKGKHKGGKSRIDMRYGGRPTNKATNQTVRVNLTQNQGLTTTAGSVFYGSYSSTLCSSCTEWASYAARYEEFRVLGLKIHFVPLYQVNTAALTIPQGAYGTTRDVALTPTSLSQVAALADSQYTSLSKSWTKSIRASDIEELLYTQTSAPGTINVMSIAVAFQSGTASTGFGLVFVDILAEFKSKN